MSFGTWLTSQHSNQASMMLAFCSIILSESLLSHNGPAGLRSFFLSSINLFGDNKSICSTSLGTYLMAKGVPLTQLAIWSPFVSHCTTDNLTFSNSLIVATFTCCIFLSTFPCILCPPTGHTSNSTAYSILSLCLMSMKFKCISLLPFTNWLPSSGNKILG